MRTRLKPVSLAQALALIFLPLALSIALNVGLHGAPLAIAQTDKQGNFEPNYLSQACVNGASRWPAKRQPITIYVKSGDGVPAYRDSFKQAVQAALQEWSSASNNKLKFTAGTADNANMTISWTDDPAKMAFSKEGGHAVVIPDQDGISKADIVLLTKQLDGSPMIDAYAKHIALHEIGHALGIFGHSANLNDIMYGIIDPNHPESTITNLSVNDINTIQALYSPAGDRFVNQTIDLNKMANLSDQSPAAQTVRLNAEAAAAIKENKLAVAMHKLEEAHNLEPENNLVKSNLGGLYANIGALAAMMRNFSQADSYFQKAIPLLENCHNPDLLKTVLSNYATILRANGRMAEAAKLDEEARNLH